MEKKKKKQKDPLQFAANLTALSAVVYLGAASVLRWGAEKFMQTFHKNATLQNPIAVPEWVMGFINIILPAAALLAAFFLIYACVAKTPLRLKLSFRMPRDVRLWLFLPVFLGVGLLCSILTNVLQRILGRWTQYAIPEPMRLPQDFFATFLYFVAVCVVPSVLEELFVRGAIQSIFSRWGTWFSIVVSSVVFALLHGDIAQMPALFLISVLMGLAAYCTGSLALGVALHFAYNTMGFLFVLTEQRMDGISALAFIVCLIVIFTLGSIVCVMLIRHLGVMRNFQRIPRVYDPKNRQSRVERLAKTPLYLCVMVYLAVRALMPLWK